MALPIFNLERPHPSTETHGLDVNHFSSCKPIPREPRVVIYPA